MDALISVFTGLINAFVGVISNLVNLANYYSSNWGRMLVYALLIFVAAKIFKVKLDFRVAKGG